MKNFPDQWKEEDVKKVRFGLESFLFFPSVRFTFLKLFQSYGSITSLAVKKDKKGRKFAFVNMMGKCPS